MYTRKSTFPLKPNSSDKAMEIGKRYGAVLHDLPGHLGTVMFADGDDFLSVTTWDTLEHAEAVASTRDAAQRDLADLLAGTPSTTIGETVVHDAG